MTERRLSGIGVTPLSGVGSVVWYAPDADLEEPPEPETIDVDDPSTTVDHLKEANIVIRSLPDPDAIRASIHLFNTQEDIETLLTELKNTW